MLVFSFSLVKMITSFCKKSELPPTWYELQHAIKRNFGGLDKLDPVRVFDKHITNIDKEACPKLTDPETTAKAMIRESLLGHGQTSNDTRYLLLLTEAYAALGILQQHMGDMQNAITIFGSSFPKDQEYTQVYLLNKIIFLTACQFDISCVC